MAVADYYNDNAAAYSDATVGVDMSGLRARFLTHIPEHGHILDAGCGSGRDSRAFIDNGYRVTAFDASTQMAQLASAYIGQSVAVLRFQDAVWTERFDGIWACASLLHVSRQELSDVLRRLARALKPGGAMYVSWKYGNQERDVAGRHFTDLDESGLDILLDQVPDLHCLEHWIGSDHRAERSQERWLNALLGKS